MKTEAQRRVARLTARYERLSRRRKRIEADMEYVRRSLNIANRRAYLEKNS